MYQFCIILHINNIQLLNIQCLLSQNNYLFHFAVLFLFDFQLYFIFNFFLVCGSDATALQMSVVCHANRSHYTEIERHREKK